MKNRSAPSGFTLVELVFVLVIMLVLIGTLIPMAVQMIRQAEIGMANASLNTLAASVNSFKSDLGIWPASDGTQQNNQVLKLLFACSDVAGCDAKYPVDGADWDFALDDDPSPAKNNQYWHLSINDPNVNASEDNNDYRRTGKNRWRGPYLFGLRDDPWGQAFVINIGAHPGVDTNSGRCWYLSAGPDGILQTSKTSADLSRDDVGFFTC